MTTISRHPPAIPATYMERLPDLRAAGARLEVTQVLEVDPFSRGSEADGLPHLRMVEGHPAYSEEFWS
jgi:hypothetical protein